MNDSLALDLSKEQQEAIDKFNGMLGPILDAAKAEIHDQGDLIKSGDAKISLVSYKKAVKAHFDSELLPLVERAQRIKNLIASLTAPADTALEDLVERQRTWMAEEKRKAAAETRRAADEVARKQREDADRELRAAEQEAADKRRDAVAKINADLKAGVIGRREAAKRMKEAGAEEEAARETAAALAEEQKAAPPPEVRVVPSIPKVAGVKNQTYYYAELLDGGEQAIITAFAAACAQKDRERAKFLWQFLAVNVSAISDYARNAKDPEKVMHEIPGVKAWSKG